jgi:hypothetical protein
MMKFNHLNPSLYLRQIAAFSIFRRLSVGPPEKFPFLRFPAVFPSLGVPEIAQEIEQVKSF